MAGNGESCYLPPLDQCLSFEKQLISWTDAYERLTQYEKGSVDDSLGRFFEDETTVQVLRQWPTPFTAGDDAARKQAKTSFEARTATTAFTHADAGNIREGAQWLANNASLDLLTALRIAIVEYLERPASDLKGASARELTSDSVVRDSFPTSFDATITKNPQALADARTTTQNTRLIETLFSERLHALKVGELLLRQQALSGDAVEDQISASLLKELSVLTYGPESSLKSWDALMDHIVEAVGVRLSGISPSEVDDPALGVATAQTYLFETIVIVQHAFLVAARLRNLPGGSPTLKWFNFMAEQQFFMNLQPFDPSLQPAIALLQSLVAVLSVVVLMPLEMQSLQLMAEHDNEKSPQRDMLTQSYLSDATCLSSLQQTFLETTKDGPGPASPALLAWLSIMITIRELAATDTSDHHGHVTFDSEDEESHNHRRSLSRAVESPFERAVAEFRASFPEPEQDVFRYMAESILNHCQAHVVVADITGALQQYLLNDTDQVIQLQARQVFLLLLQQTAFLTGYSSTLVSAVVTVSEGTHRTWDHIEADSVLRQALIGSDSILNTLTQEAKLRYPFELVPFLAFCKAQLRAPSDTMSRSPTFFEDLGEVPVFTEVLPPDYSGYEQSSPDYDYNLIEATEALGIFQMRRKTLSFRSNAKSLVRYGSKPELEIAPGARGRIIADSRPHVVAWDHSHSALQYLTNRIATVVAGCEWFNPAGEPATTLLETSEIITFFATAFEAIPMSTPQNGFSRPTNSEDAIKLLQDLRDDFSPSKDLSSVVFDVLEQQLQQHIMGTTEEGFIETLISCAKFATAITTLLPLRTWSYLARSALLPIHDGSGCLISIVESTEMLSGHYDFLIANLQLFKSLIRDTTRNLLARKTSRAVTRFDVGNSTKPATERKTSGILFAFTKTTCGLLSNASEWRYASLEDKTAVKTLTIDNLHDILHQSYAFDESQDISSKLTGIFAESAQYLVELYTSPASSTTSLSPLLQGLREAANMSYERLTLSIKSCWQGQTTSVLKFLTTLVRIKTYLQLTATAFDDNLFKLAPTLARLYALQHAYREDVLTLLGVMVTGISHASEEPPSLLGHLGSEAASQFLSLLADHAMRTEDNKLQIVLFELFSAIISNKQQWCAIYILTGGTAKDTLKSDRQRVTARSIFKVALDRISKLAALETSVAIAHLRFVKLAQDFWPRVIRQVHSHPQALDMIMEYLGTLKRNEREKDADKILHSCQETRMASLIANILAINLHTSRQLGDRSMAEKITAKLSFFKEFGVATPRYNNSLHANLKKNLEAKYPLCKLENFKRSSLQPSTFGQAYYYDIDFASEVLGFDTSWSRPHGLRAEVELANMDLSCVEAQVELVSSWRLLAIELSNFAADTPRVGELLSTTVRRCLDANTAIDTLPLLLQHLLQTRADLAFVLLERLLQSPNAISKLEDLFNEVWKAIIASGIDFESGFSDASADYYRALLRLLYLALRPHLDSSVKPTPSNVKSARPSISGPLLEVLSKVVVVGFRTIASSLHGVESTPTNAPSDLLLITAILQSTLQVRHISSLHTQIVSLFTSSNIIPYATSLFSWAEHLTVASSQSSSDRVFGELSILFLLELSNIPLMAEAMAIEAVLGRLGTSQLCQYYQNGNGRGPFDEPRRVYVIWSKGILPLALNLLTAVGAPIAAETVSFLNQYAPQLARNARSLRSRTATKRVGHVRNGSAVTGAITLGVASETHTLSLIWFALQQARTQGSAAGVHAEEIAELEWDREAVKEDLRAWLDGSRVLSERIVAVDEREERMGRMGAVRDKKCQSLLEERILEEFEGALRCLNGGEEGE